MMDGPYTTLESVKESFLGTWKDSWDSWIEKKIPIVSAQIAALFRKYGRDLDTEILEGKTSQVLVQSVADNMIVRRLASVDFNESTANVDYSQLSASMGPYSMSVSTPGGSESFYIKKDERELLGLSTITAGFIDYHFIDPQIRPGWIA